MPALVALLAVALVSCTGSAGGPEDLDRLPRSVPTAELPQPPELAEGITEHLRALQTIADVNDGTRAIGTSGYDASVDYVATRLRSAGYSVTIQRFGFDYFEELERPRLEVTSGERAFTQGDFNLMIYSASGDVDAPVTPVAYDPDATERNGPACDPGAFDGFPAGTVALLRPDPDCYYRDQVENAQEAGAAAVVLVFPDYRPQKALRPTLIFPDGISIPAISATDRVGDVLDDPGTRVRIHSRTESSHATGKNVIADLAGSTETKVVMAGGHLDSVIDGPGINDNGSGISTLVEIAEQIGEANPVNGIRFAFWGGEELGLLGSSHYVRRLSPAEVDEILVYLNFDMLASPNFVRYVYEDDGAAPSSGAITRRFQRYFQGQRLETETLDLAGRSDHGPFIQARIPIGGLFSGAEELKTAEQSVDFDGRRGKPLDPCYHLACDTIENINEEVLAEMAGAIAYAIATLAAI